MKKMILIAILLVLVGSVFSQQLSISGNFGISSPQGSAFESDNEKSAKGGLSYAADVLYHFGGSDNKLAIGASYSSSLMLGLGGDGGLFGAELYGLSLYGIKGYYRFFNSKVSPFVALSTGLTSFETPTWYINDVEYPGELAHGFGLMPELGLQLGRFVLSASYVVPVSYKFETWNDTAGSLQVMLGYRYAFDLQR